MNSDINFFLLLYSQYLISGWPVEAEISQEKHIKKKKLEGKGLNQARTEARSAIVDADAYNFLSNHSFNLSSCDENEPHYWAVKQIVSTLSCTFAYPVSYVLNNR